MNKTITQTLKLNNTIVTENKNQSIMEIIELINKAEETNREIEKQFYKILNNCPLPTMEKMKAFELTWTKYRYKKIHNKFKIDEMRTFINNISNKPEG